MISRIDIEDMTDAQDEAPERIWADRISDDIKGFVDWSEGEWSSSPFDGGTPYVRADLARAKIDRLAETCGYAISQWEDWVRDQLEGTSTFAGAMAEIEATRAAVRADLARPSQAGDERVAREAGRAEGWAEAAGFLETLKGADLDGNEFDLPADEWRVAVLMGVRACADKLAALAAMDTPKGGGDE